MFAFGLDALTVHSLSFVSCLFEPVDEMSFEPFRVRLTLSAVTHSVCLQLQIRSQLINEFRIPANHTFTDAPILHHWGEPADAQCFFNLRNAIPQWPALTFLLDDDDGLVVGLDAHVDS